MRYRYRSTLRPEINVTPFIDVVLVLLIIFMVTAPLLNVGVPLNLPQSKSAQALDKPDPLVVSLKKGPAIYLGEVLLSRQELILRLEEYEDEAEKQTVYVRAEGGLKYQDVVSVMGDLSAIGFINVVLVTELSQ